MMHTHTIDATGKVLGKVASEAAKVLMGKTRASYVANKVAEVKVTIINASKTKMSPERMKTTLHETYAGGPGSFKQLSNEKIIKDKGFQELYRLAVYGMLPANKLRVKTMKNLIITD